VDVFSGVCLLVSLSVCLHGNFGTIKLRMMKLGDYMHRTKISPEFECQGQMSKVKVTGDKKRKSATFCLGVVLWGAVLRLQFYAGGKISAFCRLVSSVHSSMPNFTPSFVNLYVNTITSERLNVG